ncbi:hypothetical protein GCM10027085_39310 [Spirosoma aerophilum]
MLKCSIKKGTNVEKLVILWNYSAGVCPKVTNLEGQYIDNLTYYFYDSKSSPFLHVCPANRLADGTGSDDSHA